MFCEKTWFIQRAKNNNYVYWMALIFKMLLYAKVHILHTLSFIVLQRAVYKYNPHFIIDIVIITRRATCGNEANIVLRPFLVAMSIFDLSKIYIYYIYAYIVTSYSTYKIMTQIRLFGKNVPNNKYFLSV